MAHVRKADRVAEDLLRQIVGGDIAVGTILPNEAELATRYGVNRGVIREAIKLLEVHALVRPVRKRGTIVLDPMASVSPKVAHALLVPARGKVSRHVLAGLLEIRAGLDEQMTRLAAERRTAADLKAMDAVLADLRERLPDQDGYAAAVGGFGRAIARASKNPFFEMLASWHEEITAELHHIFWLVRPATSAHLDGMALVVQAIRERNADGAARLVRQFHEWSSPRIQQAAALAGGDPPVERKERKKA